MSSNGNFKADRCFFTFSISVTSKQSAIGDTPVIMSRVSMGSIPLQEPRS